VKKRGGNKCIRFSFRANRHLHVLVRLPHVAPNLAEFLALISLIDYDWDLVEGDFDPVVDIELQCFEDFKEYSRIYLPAVVESKLEAILLEKLPSLRDELKSALGDVVQNSLSDLYEDWQQKRQRRTSSEEVLDDGIPNNIIPSDPPLPSSLEVLHQPNANFDSMLVNTTMFPEQHLGLGLSDTSNTALFPPQYETTDLNSYIQQDLRPFERFQGVSNDEFYQGAFPESNLTMDVPDTAELALKPSEWQLNLSAFSNVLFDDTRNEHITVCPHKKGKNRVNPSEVPANIVCTMCLGVV
jgi:hypothetical protein